MRCPDYHPTVRPPALLTDHMVLRRSFLVCQRGELTYFALPALALFCHRNGGKSRRCRRLIRIYQAQALALIAHPPCLASDRNLSVRHTEQRLLVYITWSRDHILYASWVPRAQSEAFPPNLGSKYQRPIHWCGEEIRFRCLAWAAAT